MKVLSHASGFILAMLTLLVFMNQVRAPDIQQPTLEWDRPYGGTADDMPWSMVQTDDNGYVLAGSTASLGAGWRDFWVVKTDANGNMEWSKTYGGTGDEEALSVIQTIDGGYAIAGRTSSFGAGSDDFWLIKTDVSGNMEWSRTYGGPKDDEAWCVIQTVDGGYAIAGETGSSGVGLQDFWLIKTDVSGNAQWDRTYGGANQDFARSLTESPDGGYAIAGQTSSYSAGGYDFWLIKTDAGGNIVWDKVYGGTSDDYAWSMVQTGDNGYALVGSTSSFSSGQADIWLIKTDINGNLDWDKSYGGASDDCAKSVIQTDDGGYALAGYTLSSGAGQGDFWLVKTNFSGSVQWSQTYGGTGRDEAYSLVQTSDLGYAMAGYTYSFGAGLANFWLIKISPERILATINIDPGTLNLKSNGEWITCYIELSTGLNVGDIDASTILLNGTIEVDLEAPTQIGDYDCDGIADLMVKFDRSTVIDWLRLVDYSQDTGKSLEVDLRITGMVAGKPFEGVDTVKVLLKG